MYEIEDLKDEQRFKLIKTLRYNQIVEFVFENISKANIITRLYYLINLLILGVIIGLSIAGFKHDLFTFKTYAFAFLWGFLGGSILVIPVHEILHGLAYKIKGAPKISFGVDFKQGIFYVAADKFVVGKDIFLFVALAPVVTINLLALVIFNFVTPFYLMIVLYFLLFHNIMCIGDFAMVSFFKENKNRKLFTYDDHHEKTSYIYESIT